MHRPTGSVCLAAAPWLPQGVEHANMNTNTSLASYNVVGAGPLVAEVAQRIKICARSVLPLARPNPSVEGTSNIKLRLLSAAPHVKR